MIIGRRLYQLRQEKKLSQGDIEERTGLLRCYISRVENGHTVPSLETLERLARALEIPLFQLFFDEPESASLLHLAPRPTTQELLEDDKSRGDAHFFERIQRLLARIDEKDRNLFLLMARRLANQQTAESSAQPGNQPASKARTTLRGRRLQVGPPTAA
ncbi:MAG: helix-turn-helix domain-containing protein [Candidatus Dormibacteraceae bacterium]